MKTFFTFLFGLFITGQALAHPKQVQVVVSFSILADLVRNVGGEHVNVISIVGPDEDAHVYRPKPGDSIELSKADLVFINGLGFEGWIDRLIKASGYQGQPIVASQGIDVLKGYENVLTKQHGTVDDPHAWHNIQAVMRYVDNIAEALASYDPLHAADYQKNAASYKQRLARLEQWIEDEICQIPQGRRKVITAHDAFQYFAKAYHIDFLSPQGISTDAEASPEAVRQLIDLVKEEGIQIIFVENITNERQINIIRESTGAIIGGILYSDALSSPQDPVASDYISLMRHNVSLIVDAMKLDPAN